MIGLLVRQKSAYKEGVHLYFRDGKNEEALPYFDRAIEIDPNLAYVWNDRGLCLKNMGKFNEAQMSFERALELAPKDEEYIYDYGEVLEIIGILHRDTKTLEKAVKTFSLVTDIKPEQCRGLEPPWCLHQGDRA